MKKRITMMLTAFLSALLLCSVYAPTTVLAAVETGNISVNGHGIMSVTPDIATVNIGAQTDADDAATAQQRNAEIMESVIKVLRDLGIEDNDIKTSSYYMSPKYNYIYNERLGYNESIEAGYTVSSYVHVTIRDMEEVGNILDKTAEAGANSTYGLSFNISTPEVYYSRALTAAINDAQEKAKAIAAAIGVSVEVPISVLEQGYSNVSPIYAEGSAVYDAAGARSTTIRTPIEYGQLEVSAYVNVIYEYQR